MKAGRLFAAAVALLLLATGCPSRHPAQPGTPSSSQEPAGAVTVAYPAEPATLDPFAFAGDTPATRDIARMLMPGLYSIQPSGARVRWLLASDPVVSQGPPFAVTVTLREDAVWSDGLPITVADLQFTWQRALRAPTARDGYDQISRIVAETSKRARIEFRRSFAQWQDLFSAGLGVLPAHALGSARALASLSSGWPVSGGPFVLSSWHRGLDMTFTPNPHAWNGRPKLRTLRIAFVPDDVGVLELFRRHSVDVLGPYEGADWARRARAVAGSRVSTDVGQTWMGIVLNTATSPLSDVRVRRAFVDSLDRPRIAAGLVQSQGSLLNGVPPSSSSPFATYGNVSRARATLQAAGWSGSPIRSKGHTKLTFTIAVPDSDGLAGIIARALTFQSVRAGIDAEAISLPVDELMRSWLTGSRFQAALLTWRDPPGGAARARFDGSGSVPRLNDETLSAGLLSNSGAAQARMASLLPVIPLSTLAVTLAWSARVRGPVANAEADGPFWNAQDWSAG